MADSTVYESASLEETIRCAAAGEDVAFAKLAKEFKPLILHVLSTANVPEEDKNDLYQEGLIGLYKAVLLYNPSLSSFPTFASVCIRSGITDGLRRFRKEHSIPAMELPTEEIPDDGVGSPERILLGKEELSALLEQIGKTLSPMERKVFGLHLQGRKSAEIAKLLGREPKSVENTLFRARRKLVKLS